ncbi:phosphoheptose isomerase, partial [Micromonospora sp. PPF5-17B]|nr:phosphoheptose isomerase [Micromonospora sp. PPF5-17B]
IDSPESQVVQELHLVATHVLCEYVDRALPAALAARTGAAPVRAGVEVLLGDAPDREVQAR